MAGLDNNLIERMDHQSALSHIQQDVRSDFILAPHLDVVYKKSGDRLWDNLKRELSSGKYKPQLPVTVSVPKPNHFSRPGSILLPSDRLLYQLLVDVSITEIEASIDRDRCFSHQPVDDVEKYFEDSHVSWGKWQTKIASICDDNSHILKTDVSHYFERIPHHPLINLIRSIGVEGGIVNLLEEVLLAFRERSSFGIVQGVYPSDVLGNFFLSAFEAQCDITGVPSARYVDDIYAGFGSDLEAKRGLSAFVDILRKDGLHLNESKTRIMTAENAIIQENATDILFVELRESAGNEVQMRRVVHGYGFDLHWTEELDEVEHNEVMLASFSSAFDFIREHPQHADRVEKFVLPQLKSVGSDLGVDYVMEHVVQKPHQTRLFFSYLLPFVTASSDVRVRVEALTENLELSDYQKMFLLGALLSAETISQVTINRLITWLSDNKISPQTRALAAIVAAKFGNAQQRRLVRGRYESEPSEYVRSAILYAAQYFVPADKKTCVRAWGGHGPLMSLISVSI